MFSRNHYRHGPACGRISWLEGRLPHWGKEVMERRLAAILAADMVGYSRLLELDEAGTLAALKAAKRPGRRGALP